MTGIIDKKRLVEVLNELSNFLAERTTDPEEMLLILNEMKKATIFARDKTIEEIHLKRMIEKGGLN